MRIFRVLLTVVMTVLLLLLVSFPVHADTLWVKRWTSPGYESDWAYAIALDDSGYVYVTGKTDNAGTAGDWTTIKYNQSGDTVWVKNFASAGNYNERASSIAIGQSGNIYITGYTMSSNAGDYLTIKYRPDGDTAWSQRYDGTGNGYDFSHWIAVDDNDNAYVTGYSRGLSYQNDIATVKYDSSGNQEWIARHNGTGNYNDKGHKVIADSDGYVYVVGYVNPYGSGTYYDYVTIKYNALTGTEVWSKTYNGPVDSSDIARDIAVDASGNVYVTGSSRGTGTLSDILTIKYDSSGSEQWITRYNNPDTSANDGGYGIDVDSAGNVYVTGQSQGIGTGTDIVVIKYDSTGTQQWVMRYNGPANDYDTPSDEVGGKCMVIDHDANIYVTGCSRGATSHNDYITLKYNTDGIEQWVERYNYCDSVDYGLAIAVDTEFVYVTGRSLGTGTYYDWTTVKYDATVGINEVRLRSHRSPELVVYPNPFRTNVTVHYSLPTEQMVSLSIYDVSGRSVKKLVSDCQSANSHSVSWDGTIDNGEQAAPGVYFYVLNTIGQQTQKKIVMIK